jgi:hypothetical protein
VRIDLGGHGRDMVSRKAEPQEVTR